AAGWIRAAAATRADHVRRVVDGGGGAARNQCGIRLDFFAVSGAAVRPAGGARCRLLVLVHCSGGAAARGVRSSRTAAGALALVACAAGGVLRLAASAAGAVGSVHIAGAAGQSARDSTVDADIDAAGFPGAVD